MGDDDASLLRASLDDPEQFAPIFARHHRSIWAYIARAAGASAADELAGDVFTTAFARRHTFDADRGEVRPWLYGIAGNVLRTRLRSDLRARRAFARLAAGAVDDADAAQLVVDADALTASTRDVLTAMAELDADDRDLLSLYVWERLSYIEIAAATGVPIGTVRSRLSRVRARLRELVGWNGEETVMPTTTAVPTKEATDEHR